MYNEEIRLKLESALFALQGAKPQERGELARRYAVLITEYEKLLAYYQIFIEQEAYWPKEKAG